MARVLMVEDSKSDRKLAEMLLASHFEFTYAETLQEALSCLACKLPDVVLLDLNLPDSRGMGTLDALHRLTPELPIVVWSGAGEAAEAVRRGADEFILKCDGNLEDVKQAIVSAVARHKFTSVRGDIAALQKLIETDKK